LKALSQNSLDSYREATPLSNCSKCGKTEQENLFRIQKCGNPSREYRETAALPDGFSMFNLQIV